MQIPKFQTHSGLIKSNVYKTPEGKYINDKNEELTVLNTLGIDDESLWTYKDSKGNRYTPHRDNNEQATVTSARKVSPFIHTINNYVGKLRYQLANNAVPSGEYVYPAILAAPWMAQGLLSVNGAAAMAGGWAGGKAVDAGTKFATGKTWADWVSDKTGLDKGVSEMTNPGMWSGGGYGGWAGNNFRHLGRYTLNYLNPRSYSDGKIVEMIARLKDVYTKPFYTKPPTFHNGQKPTWYTGASDDEVRFQNGAIWAGIPEEEVPRTLIQKNADGKTYRWTREALENGFYGKRGVKMVGEEGLASQNVIDKALQKQSRGEVLQDFDYFTTVGGEHSDYKVLKDFPQGVLWELTDNQKLNPQWLFTDPLKNKFEEHTFPWEALDKLGGFNLSRLLGYKPFTYRQGIGVTKDGTNTAFYFDPTHWEKTGIINPE